MTEASSSASDIARNVGNGAVSAADVLERHLAAIDAGDAEIHAFNVVTVDVARDQAAAVDAGVAAGRDIRVDRRRLLAGKVGGDDVERMDLGVAGVDRGQVPFEHVGGAQLAGTDLRGDVGRGGRIAG